jgi:hypothetical protein
VENGVTRKQPKTIFRTLVKIRAGEGMGTPYALTDTQYTPFPLGAGGSAAAVVAMATVFQLEELYPKAHPSIALDTVG